MSRRTLTAAAVAGVVLVAGGSVAYAQVQGSAGSYRTATVATGDVDKTLNLSGTISASARQDLSFGTSGTVTKVAVGAGDVVRSGATLAKLDRTSLETAVTKAKADLAKAQAKLESDQTSQADTVADATTPSGGGSSTSKDSGKPSGGSSSKPSPELAKALQQLAKQQKSVTDARTAATDAITAAKAALAAQATACAAADDSTDADPTPPSTDCATALAAVQAAQDTVAKQQDALQSALEALSQTLTGAIKAVQKSASSSTSSGTPDSASSASTPTTSSSSRAGGSGGGATVTAASLAQDQASIDTAKAALTEAKRALDAATLTAPFAGKVLSVSVVKGDSVGDSDVAVVIVGNGGTTATTTVTADQITQVKKGQTAAVTPAGATKPVSGKVTSIGLLPTSGSDTTTYPVTIDLSGEVAAPEGSTAAISLVIGTAKGVLTVPSSAVSTLRQTTVTVLTGGKPVVTPVKVGVVGPARTQISSGLKQGQQVVVADLGVDLPSGDSTTTRFPGAGGGQFRGGGAGGAAPTGARRAG